MNSQSWFRRQWKPSGVKKSTDYHTPKAKDCEIDRLWFTTKFLSNYLTIIITLVINVVESVNLFKGKISNIAIKFIEITDIAIVGTWLFCIQTGAN